MVRVAHKQFSCGHRVYVRQAAHEFSEFVSLRTLFLSKTCRSILSLFTLYSCSGTLLQEPSGTGSRNFVINLLDISSRLFIIASMRKTVGQHLAEFRKRANLTLRAVEAETGISNAYLSQLENGKVQQPSPKMLNKLAELYRVDFVHIMKLAGYPLPSVSAPGSSLHARLGPTTADEEEALADYLDFLRSKRPGRFTR
jgi:transcriptional regulator with XRE-family HTH domain